MSIIIVKEIVKQKPDYSGTSPRGPYTIHSKVVKAEVDGNAREIELKTFKADHNALCVAGSSWMADQDTKALDKGYDNVYTLKQILAAGGAGVPAPAGAQQAQASPQSYAPSGSRDLIIQAQTCLKAAVDLVASCTDAAAYGSLADRKSDVLSVADDFLAWVTERGSGKKANDAPPDDLPFK